MTTKYWLEEQPHRWKTFVAYCVSEIQTICSALEAHLHYCPGQYNPADLVTEVQVSTCFLEQHLTLPVPGM